MIQYTSSDCKYVPGLMVRQPYGTRLIKTTPGHSTFWRSLMNMFTMVLRVPIRDVTRLGSCIPVHGYSSILAQLEFAPTSSSTLRGECRMTTSAAPDSMGKYWEVPTVHSSWTEVLLLIYCTRSRITVVVVTQRLYRGLRAYTTI